MVALVRADDVGANTRTDRYADVCTDKRANKGAGDESADTCRLHLQPDGGTNGCAYVRAHGSADRFADNSANSSSDERSDRCAHYSTEHVGAYDDADDGDTDRCTDDKDANGCWSDVRSEHCANHLDADGGAHCIAEHLGADRVADRAYLRTNEDANYARLYLRSNCCADRRTDCRSDVIADFAPDAHVCADEATHCDTHECSDV